MTFSETNLRTPIVYGNAFPDQMNAELQSITDWSRANILRLTFRVGQRQLFSMVDQPDVTLFYDTVVNIVLTMDTGLTYIESICEFRKSLAAGILHTNSNQMYDCNQW